ncbi:MAG TPA: hypothetical protein VLL52_16260 [Anaerolineae bacterium]|nr:hypothetical protein [Anaerolineae bacterium]
MSELRSSWKDSGYDCDHCGGQIFERTDEGLMLAPHVYHQCRLCGCQWSLKHELIRLGTKDSCREQSRAVVGGAEQDNWKILGWVLGAIVLLFVFTRIGFILGLVVRFAIPILFVGLIAVVFYRLGRAEEWW